jgi:hypothetical protein
MYRNDFVPTGSNRNDLVSLPTVTKSQKTLSYRALKGLVYKSYEESRKSESTAVNGEEKNAELMK